MRWNCILWINIIFKSDYPSKRILAMVHIGIWRARIIMIFNRTKVFWHWTKELSKWWKNVCWLRWRKQKPLLRTNIKRRKKRRKIKRYEKYSLRHQMENYLYFNIRMIYAFDSFVVKRWKLIEETTRMTEGTRAPERSSAAAVFNIKSLCTILDKCHDDKYNCST